LGSQFSPEILQAIVKTPQLSKITKPARNVGGGTFGIASTNEFQGSHSRSNSSGRSKDKKRGYLDKKSTNFMSSMDG